MLTTRFKNPIIRLIVSSLLMVPFALSIAGPAFADGGGGLTPTITGDGRSVTNNATYNSGNPTIDDATLTNGSDTSLTIKMPLTVKDATGTGAGWTVYVAAKQFSTGNSPSTFHTIRPDAITFKQAVADTGTGSSLVTLDCVSGSTCSLPDTLQTINTPVSAEPASLHDNLDTTYTVQYDTTGYAGTMIASASANKGMGTMNIEADFKVNLLAEYAYIGTYTSTFAITFTTGPVS